MKRLAILAAAVFGPAVYATPPDPETQPGAQLAPTLPQVPRPVLKGSDLTQGEAGRAELPLPPTSTRHHIRPTVKVEPGPDSIPAGLPGRGSNGGAGTPASLPPILPPPPVPDKPTPPPPAPPTPAAPACGADCQAAGHRGAWRQYTTFLFYRPSKIWLGLHPTPYQPPYHTEFLCMEKAGCGPAGCGPAGCAGMGQSGPGVGQPAPGVGQDPAQGPASGPGPVGGPVSRSARPSLVSRLFTRNAVKPDRGWATAGETIPGYRLAVPETPAVTGQRYPSPPVVGTSYRIATPEK
jgi:hypothetical protein